MKRRRNVTYTRAVLPMRKKRRLQIVPYRPRANVSPGELKFHEVTVAAGAAATAGTIVTDSLVKIAQGLTESTRVGRKVTVRKVSVRGSFVLPDTNVQGDATDKIRYIMYLDKQANGATATVANILNTANVDSFLALENKNRFWVLYDKTEDMAAQAGSWDGSSDRYTQQIKHFEFHKKCNIPIEYSSTAGAITEIRSYNLGVLAISERGVTTIDSITRIRFTD